MERVTRNVERVTRNAKYVTLQSTVRQQFPGIQQGSIRNILSAQHMGQFIKAFIGI